MACRRCGFPGLGAPCGGPGCEVPAPPPAVEASGDVKRTWFTYAEAEHIQEGAYARGLADAADPGAYQRGLDDADSLIPKLHAENARLRAALVRIYDYSSAETYVRDIAARALGEGKP